jgi:AcrR family transcriptional regulator
VRGPRAAQLVAVALGLLERDGPEALTMRALAEAVGIRAPSIYKHLPDKATLEAALVEEALADVGAALHAAVGRPGRRGLVGALLTAYRTICVPRPHLYRLATGGSLHRELLPPGLEDWAGEPFFLATGDPHRSQALWSMAHGLTILEIDRRYPPGSDLDRTWGAAASAFTDR